MEDALKEHKSRALYCSSRSRNPCFNGRCTQRSKDIISFFPYIYHPLLIANQSKIPQKGGLSKGGAKVVIIFSMSMNVSVKNL